MAEYIFFLSAILFLFLLTPGAYAQSLNCADCHVSQHGGVQCPDCTTCHTTIVQGTNHHSGVCASCHTTIHPSPVVPGPCSVCHGIEAAAPLNHRAVYGMPGNCTACHTEPGVAPLPGRLNITCWQCHGGGTSPETNPPQYPILWLSDATLAARADGIHWVTPDLVIISPFTLSTSMTTPGGVISVTDSTKNRGGGPAGASATAFYLSSTTTCGDGDDVLLSPVRSVPSLAYNETSTGTTSVTIPGGTAPGTYYVCAKADNGGVVAEFDETNNTAISSALSVVGNDVDLVISAFFAPTSAKRGTNISIADATKNRLSGTAGPSTTAFYLSTNTTLDGGDVLLGSRAVPALGSGAQSSGTTSVTIPSGATAGSYYLIWKADNGGVIAETDENNNTKYKAITITN